MRNSPASILSRIADSGRFQGFIFAVIVANAAVLGMQTYEGAREAYGPVLRTLDSVFLGIFVVELAIRIGAFGRRPQDFFRDGWNVFDFVVIAAAFAPGLRQNATLLRLVRLLRVVRLVSFLPDMRVLVRGMIRSLAPIASMAVMALLLMYVYGMVGWILFHNQDPANWGTIGDSMLNLFVVMTLENWPDLLQRGMEIHPASWIYFVSYVMLGSFLLINVVIAIIINSMEEARAIERRAAQQLERELRRTRQAAEEAHQEREEITDAVQALRQAVDHLEERLSARA